MGKTKIPIFCLKPGMILANDILSYDNKVLLSRGQRLSAEHIAILNRLCVYSIDVFFNSYSALDDMRFLRDKKELNELYNDILRRIKKTLETIYLFKTLSPDEIDESAAYYTKVLIDTAGAIEFLFKLRMHSDYTYRHSINVGIISGIIGEFLGIKEDQLRNVVLTGFFHDVGKLMIPQVILNKPGKLTEQEMSIIKNHPGWGYQLLGHFSQFCDDAKLGVLQHHERLDGSGYPLGLGHGKISLYARVVAIADIYDAMTTDRCYRGKETPFCAAETIAKQMYRQLDSEICLAFLKNI